MLLIAACSSSNASRRPTPTPPSGLTVGAVERGNATWYGGSLHGGPTASGERFDQNAMTAAHKTLPMNSKVRVTNLENRRSVVVRINDRGPYARGRIIDLSRAAARVIDMIAAGVVPVTVEILSLPERRRQ
jgi:rare lipoprotein A